LANDIVAIDYPEMSPQEESKFLLDAVLNGFASGYNDFLKARLMWKSKQILSAGGIPQDYEATHEEALARGLFGMSSAGQKDLWALTKDMNERMKALDEVATTYHEKILNLTTLYANKDSYSHEYFRNRLAQERAMLMGLEPEERTYVMKKFGDLENSRKVTHDSVTDRILDVIMKNGPTATEYLIHRVNQSEAIDPKDKGKLTDEIRKHGEALDKAGELWDPLLEKTDQTMQDMPDKLGGRTAPAPPYARGKIKGNTPPRKKPEELTEEEKKELGRRALESDSLQEKADIARQLGADEDEVAALLAKAPRRTI
jgi:hypothetical protein